MWISYSSEGIYSTNGCVVTFFDNNKLKMDENKYKLC